MCLAIHISEAKIGCARLAFHLRREKVCISPEADATHISRNEMFILAAPSGFWPRCKRNWLCQFWDDFMPNYLPDRLQKLFLLYVRLFVC